MNKTKTNAAKAKKTSLNNRTELQSLMASIRDFYQEGSRSGLTTSRVVFEKPGKMSLSSGTLKIFSKESLDRNKEAVDAWEEAGEPHGMKPADPTPVRTYVFYPSSADSGRLGSVSIYSPDLNRDCVAIRLNGTLFGLRVIKVEMKEGRRPFIDVTFRP